MDQETFNKKMDELDRKNPRPIKNFYSAERIAAIAASAAAPQVVADEREALEDLRTAVKDGVSDEWLLGFIRQIPLAAAPASIPEIPDNCTPATTQEIRAAAPVQAKNMVPLSVDGKSVWIDGVGDVALVKDQELDKFEGLFLAACSDLGLINEALGLDPDDGGAGPILDAIEELKESATATPVQPVAVPDGDLILVERELLGEACYAMTHKKEAFETLNKLREITFAPAAAPAAQDNAKDEAYEFAARVIELFDDATMRANYMLDSGECAKIIRALKGTEIAAIAAAPVVQGDALIESNLREIIAKTSDDYARYVAQTTLATIAAKEAS